MSLAAYTPRTEKVKAGDTEFEVRGLSSTDIGVLIERNIDDLVSLFDMFQSQKSDINESEIISAIVKLPRMTVAAIVLASTEDADMEVLANAARQLPLPVQIDALMKIGKLTFEDAGGLGKFIGNLKGLVEKAKVTRKAA